MTNNSEQAVREFYLYEIDGKLIALDKYGQILMRTPAKFEVIEYKAYQLLKDEINRLNDESWEEKKKLKEELLNYGKAVTHFEDKAEKLQQENERLSKENDQLVLRMSELRETRRESDKEIKMLTEALVRTQSRLSSYKDARVYNLKLSELNEDLNSQYEMNRDALAKLRQGGGDEKK